MRIQKSWKNRLDGSRYYRIQVTEDNDTHTFTARTKAMAEARFAAWQSKRRSPSAPVNPRTVLTVGMAFMTWLSEVKRREVTDNQYLQLVSAAKTAVLNFTDYDLCHQLLAEVTEQELRHYLDTLSRSFPEELSSLYPLLLSFFRYTNTMQLSQVPVEHFQPRHIGNLFFFG